MLTPTALGALALATPSVLAIAAWLHLARPGRGRRRPEDRVRDLEHERAAHLHYIRQLVAERDELHASWRREYTAHRACRVRLVELEDGARAAADATGWAVDVPAPVDREPRPVLFPRPPLSGSFRVPGYAIRYFTTPDPTDLTDLSSVA